MKKVLLIIPIIIILGLFYYLIFLRDGSSERLSDIPTFITPNDNNIDLSEIPPISTIAENLEVPWAMDFLPDNRMIFTERMGKVKIIEGSGNITEVASINVHSVSESGLHGIAIDPAFEQNNNIYLYYTYRTSGANTLNRVSKFILDGNNLLNETIIVDEIPGAPNHDGGRIKFGPDGYLYITTGDAQEPTRAQDRNSLAGKILRVDTNGNEAPNNPFNSSIYSFGHRNPQGITWDDEGNLWATEHGRSGINSGLDELNLIELGGNYGWPDIEGNETQSGMIAPIIHSGATTTWAPGGAAYLNGSIFFTGLRGQSLYEYDIAAKELKTHLNQKLGRIRDVVAGTDGLLYISTSNRDGRGQPSTQDDRIFRINPSKLSEL